MSCSNQPHTGKNPQQRTFSEQRIKQNFSGTASFYDYWAQLTESQATNKVLELADIQGWESVLEVGVGTGMLFKELLKRNENGFTTGLDLSGVMLSKAKERCYPYQEDRDFSLRQASVYDLSSLEKNFDVLISCYMLDLLPETDFVRLLQNFKTVLRPSGKIVLCSMTFGWKWYQKGWELLTSYFRKLFTDCRPISLVPYLHKAGYQIEEVKYISQNTFPSQVVMARI